MSQIAALLMARPHIAQQPDLNTLLLLRANGIDGSTSIVDLSTYGRVISKSAEICNSTAHVKNNNTSIYLPANKSLAPAGTNPFLDFQFGTGDLTFEWYSYWTSGVQGTYSGFLHCAYSPGNNYATFGIRVGDPGFSNKIQFYTYGQGFGDVLNTVHTLATLQNAWHHWAWVRKDGYWTLYLDGNALAITSFLDATPRTSHYSLQNLNVTAISFGSAKFDQWIDELRISKVARYTANFVPPVSVY
jgi:hypothetical protein